MQSCKKNDREISVQRCEQTNRALVLTEEEDSDLFSRVGDFCTYGSLA
jgi:uncharacterized protein YwlG (UPF0340 family)